MAEQAGVLEPLGADPGDLRRSVAQVLDASARCVGTGFLLEGGLLVSCAHVITGRDGDDPPPAGPVTVRFAHLDGRDRLAEVVPAWWHGPDRGDVAFLRLAQPPPDQARGLRLAEQVIAGRRVRSFGFPVNAPAQGHYGYAVVGDRLISDTGQALVQLRDATEITEGFSGAPVVDERTGLVIGMVDSVSPPDRLQRGRATAYLTPVERLRAICPRLPASGVRPYRGLASFTSDDTEWFFGRDRAVDLVLERLRAAPECRVLALLGPSGSGKTSLVQAGVLPALAGGALPGSRRWGSVTARPGGDPFAELDRAGLTGAGQGLGQAVNGWLADHPDHDRLLVIVDQLEELFASSVAPPDRRRLLDQLADLADQQPQATVVLVMRDEFYSQLAAAAPALMRGLALVNVPPTLQGDELTAIIAEPAARAGLALEPGLVGDVVGEATGLEEDAAPAAVLPLLEFALTELWEQHADGELTRDGYRRIGGLTGALAGRCDKALAELAGQRTLARRLLVDLVADPDDAHPDLPLTRRRRRRSQLSPAVRDDPGLGEVVGLLADQRLLVTGHDPASDEPTYEIVHDSLLRHWGQLRAWLDGDRDFRAWRARLEANHRDWAASRGQPLTGGALEHAQHQLNTRRADLPDHLAAYIEDSARADHHRRTRDRRRVRQLTVSLALVLLLFALTAGLGVYTFYEAQRRSRLAESQGLAATASSMVDRQPELGMLLSLQAVSIADTPQAYGSLQAQLSRPLHARHPLTGHAGPVWSVAFSPDGAMLATASDDQTVRLWDIASHQPLGRPLAGHASGVTSVAFSPDGAMLATASDDQTVRLWDVASRRPLGEPLTGHTGPVWSVAFSPDGALLATASDDQTVRLWDIASRQEIGQLLTSRTGPARSVVFNPGGTLLATAIGDGTVRLWDVVSRQQVGQPLTGHTDTIEVRQGATHRVFGDAVAFSPDGVLLAITANDETVRLWDVASHQPLGEPLTGHTSPVHAVVFSPDGVLLATASSDQTVRLWDVASRQEIGQPLTGHDESVDAVAFSLDSALLATGSQDGMVRLWDVATRQPLGQRLTGSKSLGSSVVLSPDGTLLATAVDDTTVRLWDVASRQEIGQPLTGHDQLVNAVAFSPDGALLATGSQDGTVRLWDVISHRQVGQPLTDHTDWIDSVAFSPDGALLAIANLDGTVRLWDVAARRPLGQPLTGHTDRILSVAFSPNGRVLATASFDGTVRLWDVASHQPLGWPLGGHASGVTSVAFSPPDGVLLATASFDGTVRLWDVASRQEFGQPLTGHTNAVNALALSPDGALLASASSDQTVRLWALPRTWIDQACELVGRNLSQAEWDEYIGGDRRYVRQCEQLPAGPGAPADAPAARYPAPLSKLLS